MGEIGTFSREVFPEVWTFGNIRKALQFMHFGSGIKPSLLRQLPFSRLSPPEGQEIAERREVLAFPFPAR
jgi:hypothetical protein